MDEFRDGFHLGRRNMLDAFLKLSTLARQAGADGDDITKLHGQFFDGNVSVKTSFRAVILLAEIWKPVAPDRLE